MTISVPCVRLKPNWLSAVHRYLASRDSKTCSSTLERAVAIAIGQQLLTSAGSFDMQFSSGMITGCIRVRLVAYQLAYNRKGILTSWSPVAEIHT